MEIEEEHNKQGEQLTEKMKEELIGKYRICFSPSTMARNYSINLYVNTSKKGVVNVDVFDAMINLVFLMLIIFLLSRVAHFMKYTKNRLDEIDEKVNEIKDSMSKKN